MSQHRMLDDMGARVLAVEGTFAVGAVDGCALGVVLQLGTLRLRLAREQLAALHDVTGRALDSLSSARAECTLLLELV